VSWFGHIIAAIEALGAAKEVNGAASHFAVID